MINRSGSLDSRGTLIFEILPKNKLMQIQINQTMDSFILHFRFAVPIYRQYYEHDLTSLPKTDQANFSIDEKSTEQCVAVISSASRDTIEKLLTTLCTSTDTANNLVEEIMQQLPTIAARPHSRPQ